MRGRDKDIIVTLSDKRLLSIDEFAVYASIGISKAREMAEVAGAVFKVGKRVLVDRIKFDRWCDENDEM